MRSYLVITFLLGTVIEAYSQTKIPKLVVNMGHTNPIERIQLTDNQKYILSCAKNETKLWDFKTGRLIRNLKQTGVLKINKEATLYAHDGKIYSLKKDSLLKDLSSWKDTLDEAIDFGSKYVIFKTGVYELISGKLKKKWPVGELSADEKYIFSESGLFEIATETILRNYVYDWPLKGFDKVNLRYQWSNLSDTISIFDCKTNLKIKSILYSPAGNFVNSYRTLAFNDKYIATGSGFRYGLSSPDSRDTTIKIYDYESGVLLKTLPGHVLAVNDLVFSKDNKFLISAGDDRVIRIWDIATGALFMKLGGITSGINQVCFNKDGTKIASSGDAPRIWDLKLGNLTQRFKGHADVVSGVLFLPNDSGLVSCSFDKTIKTWNISTGQIKRNMRGHSNRIFGIKMANDGKTIISTTATGEVPDRLGIDKTGWDKKQSLKKWDLNSGKQLLSGYATHNSAISPDGNYMVCYREGHSQTEEEMADGYNQRMVVLDYKTGEKINEVRINGDYGGYGSYTPTFQFFKDSKNVLIGYGNQLLINNIDTGWYAIDLPDDVNVRTIAMNHAETIVAIGTYNSNIYLFDLKSKKVIATFKGHQSDILSLDFSPDDKKLVSGSFDTQIKLWDLTKNIEMVSFIAINGGDEYITYSPDGYYMSSKGATQAIHFIIDDEVFLFDQFDLKYNRPDTILLRLGSNETELMKLYREAYYKRLKKSGLTLADLNSNFEIPEISRVNLMSNPKKDVLKYSLDAQCNYNGAIKTLYAWVNDIPLYGSNGIELKTKSKTLNYTDSITLSNGINKIQFSVADNHGVESLKQTYYISNTFSDGDVSMYLIGISVSKYADDSYNLKYAVKDGRDFSTLFAQNNEAIKIDTLFDKDAVKSKINALRKNLLKTKVDDIVIFYISGHGLLDAKQDFFYATQNVNFTNPGINGFSYSAIDNLLDSIPSRKKLLLIDACHSGDVDKDEKKPEPVIATPDTPKTDEIKVVYTSKGSKTMNTKSIAKGAYSSFELMQELFANINRGNGTIVLSASAGNSFALESDEWKNGIFTYCLIKGLKEKAADENKDNTITVNELKAYVSAKVVEMTNGKQKPTSRQQNLEFNWEIWKQ